MQSSAPNRWEFSQIFQIIEYPITNICDNVSKSLEIISTRSQIFPNYHPKMLRIFSNLWKILKRYFRDRFKSLKIFLIQNHIIAIILIIGASCLKIPKYHANSLQTNGLSRSINFKSLCIFQHVVSNFSPIIACIMQGLILKLVNNLVTELNTNALYI